MSLETKIAELIVALEANTAAINNQHHPKVQEDLPVNEEGGESQAEIDEIKAEKKFQAEKKKEEGVLKKRARETKKKLEEEEAAEEETKAPKPKAKSGAPTHNSVRNAAKGKIMEAEVADRAKIKKAFQDLVAAFGVEKLTDLDADQTAEIFEQVQDL
tara:strand:+ start:1784 stop:2257 length:474 start_codon:yes stop_codon:yes gene_type:complete